MSLPWETRQLPDAYDRLSPGGVAQIRLLPSFEQGELAHARVVSTQPSRPGRVVGMAELFYVVRGEAELWRRSGDLFDVSPLVPRRCASIPAGVDYQFRASEELELVVLTAPRWERENWIDSESPYWDDEGNVVANGSPRPGPWITIDLPSAYDYLAPDGSEIRLLPTYDAGGFAHCRLPAGRISDAVRHRTVVEVWYVLAGNGAVWRAGDAGEEVVRVTSGTALTIPVATSFQFRAGDEGPLEILIGTFPRWPGSAEAEAAEGHWPTTARIP